MTDTPTTTDTPIELIAVDLDGTLLNGDNQLSARNEQALKDAMSQGVRVIIATGKTRASAADLFQRLQFNAPGIFVQGLMIYQPDGTISHQQTLHPDVVRQMLTYIEERGYEVVLYSGTRLIANRLNDRVNALTVDYHEPAPELAGPLVNLVDDMPINKMIAVRPNDPKRITALRWQIERQLDGQASVVQSMVRDMLEIVPPGSSKGAALRTVLKQLNIPAERVLAIGDAENDLAMLKLAGISVAVGNAAQAVKDAADHVVASNQDDGVAEAIERFVLKRQPEEAAASAEAAPETSTDAATSEDAAASTDDKPQEAAE